jgi:hypothetical protein
MKALIFQTVVREADFEGTGAQKKGRRRRKIEDSKIYSIPEFLPYGMNMQANLISDSLNYGVVNSCVYSVKENSWRTDALLSAKWRKYQTMLNRARRAVGIHGAIFTETFQMASTTGDPPSGKITSFTETGYLSVVENDTDTQNEWDEGDLVSDAGTAEAGVLLRLARNNAVFFIPSNHLDVYEILKTPSSETTTEKAEREYNKFKIGKSLFGHKALDKNAAATISPSPRMIGVKNIFASYGSVSPGKRSENNAAAPTGTITSFSGGGIVDVLADVRDFEEDIVGSNE